MEAEAETRDSPAKVTMEDGRPAELAPYRWWAEGEQRGCQMTGVEEAGSGGYLWASGLSGLVCAAHTHQTATPSRGSATDRGTAVSLCAGHGNWSPLWAGLGDRSPLWAKLRTGSSFWAGCGNWSD